MHVCVLANIGNVGPETDIELGVWLQALPANWPNNHDSIGKKGWAFLLPTVTPEDAKTYFPDCHTCKVCACPFPPLVNSLCQATYPFGS